MYEENVSEWENYHGTNLLHNMYNEKESKWYYLFQLKVITDILSQDSKMRKKIDKKLCIQERDLKSVLHVFLPNASGKMSRVEYMLLHDLATFGDSLNAKKKSIFLECDFAVGYERMKKRGRPAEASLTFAEYRELCVKMDAVKPFCTHVIDCTFLSSEETARKVFGIMLEVR